MGHVLVVSSTPSAILIDWCLAQLSLEGCHPATEGSRCRDSKPNISQAQYKNQTNQRVT